MQEENQQSPLPAEKAIVQQHLGVRLFLGILAFLLCWFEPLGRALISLAVLLPFYFGSEALMQTRLGWLKIEEAKRRERERAEERARLAEERARLAEEGRREAAAKYFDLEDKPGEAGAEPEPPQA